MSQVDLNNIYKDVSDEEFSRLHQKSREAVKRGDLDEAWRIIAPLPHSPYGLKGLKAIAGADFIRKHKINTSTADAKFGEGWLDE